jgi:hypothetical protein
MSGVTGQPASLGQGKGPDVELIVTGTPYYASYETPDGFAAVYDEALELFCYARLDPDGSLASTGVSVALPPPPGLQKSIREADAVRAAKIEARSRQLDGNAGADGEGDP